MEKMSPSRTEAGATGSRKVPLSSTVTGSHVRSPRVATPYRRSERPVRGRPTRGLVCLVPPVARQPLNGSCHGVVSELAAWLHGSAWPVEIVAGNDPPAGLSCSPGNGAVTNEFFGLSYRLKRLAPWIVHAFEPSEAGAASMAGARYVLSVRKAPQKNGVHPDLPDSRPEFESVLSNARQVITQSRSAARNLLENFGFDSTVIPDGVDTDRLRAVPARRTRPLIVCPTSELDERDFHVLADSFVRVVSSVSDVQLAIAGPVGARTHRELVARVPERFRGQLLVLDKADRKRLLTMFGRASVTCIPSATASSSKSAVESLAVGTPVVCAEGGAAAEVIDEDAVAAGAGVRFRPGDVDQCASSLTRVIERSGSERVSEGCRSRAYLFDWSFVGPRLVDLYRHAADSA
jgi:glycosyltransferase involved in cell wall biosynthesis